MFVLLSSLLMGPDTRSKRNLVEKRVYVAPSSRLQFIIAEKSLKPEIRRQPIISYESPRIERLDELSCLLLLLLSLLPLFFCRSGSNCETGNCETFRVGLPSSINSQDIPLLTRLQANLI